MTFCAAFGWIIILDNTLLLADDLKEHVKHGRQINDYLIKSAVNLLFDSDILRADMFFMILSSLNMVSRMNASR